MMLCLRPSPGRPPAASRPPSRPPPSHPPSRPPVAPGRPSRPPGRPPAAPYIYKLPINRTAAIMLYYIDLLFRRLIIPYFRGAASRVKYRAISVPLCSKTITFEGLDGQVAAYWTPKSCQGGSEGPARGSKTPKVAPVSSTWPWKLWK